MTDVAQQVGVAVPRIRVSIDLQASRSPGALLIPGLHVSDFSSMVRALETLALVAAGADQAVAMRLDNPGVERILSAAAEAATAERAPSVSTIARSAGVSMGAIYSYFASRDDLLKAAEAYAHPGPRVLTARYWNPLEVVLAMGAGATALLAILRTIRDWDAQKRVAIAAAATQEARVTALTAIAGEIVRRVEADGGQLPLDRLLAALDDEALLAMQTLAQGEVEADLTSPTST